MFSLLLAIIYLTFISLGLPDAVLGSAWPLMRTEFAVPIDYAGYIQMIIALGTIISSFFSGKTIAKLGTAKLTLTSVAATAIALFGFSFSTEYWHLILWAIPYGLGAGGVDSALNNYAALYYSSKHMSWLHAMWGIGASTGPLIMTFALCNQGSWQSGYRIIGVAQVFLTALILFSLPLWGRQSDNSKSNQLQSDEQNNISIIKVMKLPGFWYIIISFFSYYALETTAGLWISSYLVYAEGLPKDVSAGWASIFYMGITLGRIINGFFTYKFNNTQLIRAGSAIAGVGIISIMLPFGATGSAVGFILMGLGFAPIFPCIIHNTPYFFGENNSQAVVGVEMAFSAVGSLIMPTLFGIIAERLTIKLLPFYLAFFLILLISTYEKLYRDHRKRRKIATI